MEDSRCFLESDIPLVSKFYPINFQPKPMRFNNIVYLVISAVLIFPFLSTAQEQPPTPYPAGAKVNYVRSFTPKYPEIDPNQLPTRPFEEVTQTTQYLDGLGRPLQTVVRQGAMGTGSGAFDLVSPHVYDAYGREKINYRPFAANTLAGSTTTADGAFKMNPFQQQIAFYNLQWATEPEEINIGAGQGNFAYQQTNFEPSPLNRPVKSLAPGKNWVGVNRGVEDKYWMNTATDQVINWRVTVGAIGAQSTYSITGNYLAGTLYKSITTDENGKQVIQFTDKEGRIILKKVQLTATADLGNGSGHSGWLCTYYLYNDFGQLSCVIQPRGVELLPITVGPFSDITLLAEQCFRYEYDQRGRMISKKAPGAVIVQMVYDAMDRLVMSQDGNLQAKNKWLITLYDALNRPVETGLLLNTFNNRTFAQHLTAANSSSSYPFAATNPPSIDFWEWMTVMGYDDYNSIPPEAALSGALDNAPNNSQFIQTTYNVAPEYAQPLIQSNRTKGMVTWTKARLLNSWATYSGVYTVNIYDEKGQLIQQKANIAGIAMAVTTMQYSWDGKLLRKVESYDRGVGEEITGTVTKMQYDELGRLLQIDKKVASTLVAGGALPANWKPIVRYSYDYLGQVTRKDLGLKPESTTEPLAKQDLSYNVRGWLLSINKQFVTGTEMNDRYFGAELGYDKPASLGNFTPQYNGNIAGTLWKSEGDLQGRKYDFSYDATNRLLGATFGQYVSGAGTGAVFNLSAGLDFSVSNLTYDANGNIKTMTQRGWKPSGSFNVDELRYNYADKSNKLKNVVDNQNDPNTALGDFRANQAYLTTLGGIKTDAATDFEYDANGNMKRDRNKSIESIQYNHLNLPEKVTFLIGGAPREIAYAYDAFGTKIIKYVIDPGQETTKYTYYLGPNVYMKDSLSGGSTTLRFINHEEGRIRYTSQTGPDPAKLDYDFFLKDHLGNVRSIVTEQVQIDPYQALAFEGTAEEVLYQDQQWDNRTGESINVASVRQAWPSSFTAIYGTNSGNGQYAMPVKKSTGAIGAAKMLKVMAGDKIHTAVDYYYNAANYNNSPAAGKNSLVNTIASVILNLTSPTTFVLKNGATQIASSLNNSTSVINFFSSQGPGSATDAKPKAYLNILFFDERFVFDQTNSLSIAVTANSNTKATIDKTYANAVQVKKSGYVYLYFSNESETTVLFDNFLLGHERGRLLEETHYYPFGLTMAGISSKAMGKLENKYKFNDGTELASKEFSDGSGLDWYETEFRSYDPQIGRFHQIDPLAILDYDFSPFSFANSNPILSNDPTGLISQTAHVLCPDCPDGEMAKVKDLPEVVVTAKKGLDAANGQVLPAQSFLGWIMEGRRSWVGHVKDGDGYRTKLYDVDDKGYLTGRMGMLQLTAPTSIDRNPVVTLRQVLRMKNFIKNQYVVYRYTKNGLPYIGKALKNLVARYGSSEKVAKLGADVIKGLDNIPNNAVALGVEQLVIDLNGGIGTGSLANKIPATVKEIYINEARYWLDTNIPNWLTALKFQ